MNSSEDTIEKLIRQSGIDLSSINISKECLIVEVLEEEDFQQYPADIEMVEDVAGRFIKGIRF